VTLAAPTTAEQLREIIAQAAAAGTPLEVIGGGSKRWYGRQVAARAALSTAELAGVVDYQPAELICVTRPGTPLAVLEKLLDESGQMLAFEPPHWGPGATIGGVVACNLSGPRRIKAGAARDHLLGFQAVTGRGELIRGGGRVVKNVTGYDLSKLMCGSFGTLAVFSELCLKVLPKPETERTLAVELPEAEAPALLRAVSRSPHEPSALACLPPDVARPPALAGLGAGKALALIRLDGPESSVAHRCAEVARMTPGASHRLEAEASRALWRAVRELEPLPLREGERLWRISVAPTEGPRVVAALRAAAPVRAFQDWAGGLVWAALPAAADGAVHAAARAAGGHARLLRAGNAPAPEDVFAPLDAGPWRLHENLKRAFDPQGVLNPGRMYARL
jgi:glycolate oxidase FAD binding subunit